MGKNILLIALVLLINSCNVKSAKKAVDYYCYSYNNDYVYYDSIVLILDTIVKTNGIYHIVRSNKTGHFFYDRNEDSPITLPNPQLHEAIDEEGLGRVMKRVNCNFIFVQGKNKISIALEDRNCDLNYYVLDLLIEGKGNDEYYNRYDETTNDCGKGWYFNINDSVMLVSPSGKNM